MSSLWYMWRLKYACEESVCMCECESGRRVVGMWCANDVNLSSGAGHMKNIEHASEVNAMLS